MAEIGNRVLIEARQLTHDSTKRFDFSLNIKLMSSFVDRSGEFASAPHGSNGKDGAARHFEELQQFGDGHHEG